MEIERVFLLDRLPTLPSDAERLRIEQGYLPDPEPGIDAGAVLEGRLRRVTRDNGRVEWYDLDLPDVIELRRKMIGDEGERYHLLACSVFEEAWLDAVKVHSKRPFLFNGLRGSLRRAV